MDVQDRKPDMILYDDETGLTSSERHVHRSFQFCPVLPQKRISLINGRLWSANNGLGRPDRAAMVLAKAPTLSREPKPSNGVAVVRGKSCALPIFFETEIPRLLPSPRRAGSAS